MIFKPKILQFAVQEELTNLQHVGKGYLYMLEENCSYRFDSVLSIGTVIHCPLEVTDTNICVYITIT